MKRVRAVAIALAAIVLFASLAQAVFGLPHYGEARGSYGQRRNEVAIEDRHVTNLDAFVNFDLRAFDTLGEELLLLTAVCGLGLLLRDARDERTQESMPPREQRVIVRRSELVRWLAPLAIGSAVVLGCGTIVHGQLTPGGGFQGGVTIASALISIWLAYGYRTWNRLTHVERVEPLEALGAAGYILTGMATTLAGGAFLQNVVALGGTGALVSGGTIWIVNLAIGLEVFAAFLVVFAEFAHGTRRKISNSS